jgi:hypothetical protein
VSTSIIAVYRDRRAGGGPIIGGMDDDWRLAGNEDLFRGAVFVRKPYPQWSPEWDHEYLDWTLRPEIADGT